MRLFPKGTVVYCQCGAPYVRAVRDFEAVGFIRFDDFEPIGEQKIEPGNGATCVVCGKGVQVSVFEEAAQRVAKEPLN